MRERDILGGAWYIKDKVDVLKRRGEDVSCASVQLIAQPPHRQIVQPQRP